MKKTAFLLFPGQGAQAIGMAKDAAAAGGHARSLFEEASEILGFDLAAMVFDGDAETLARTENCQPALLVSCLALYETLRERAPIEVAGAAGLSLGEYTALVALEAMDFSDAVRLVRNRGLWMEEAVREVDTGMVSILGLDAGQVEAICQQVGDAGKAWPANFNCPGQIVISGDKPGLEKASELAKEAGAKRALPLNVSGAFHSPFMQPAQDKLRAALQDVMIREPSALFINNADAAPLTDPEAIRESLARQLVSPVRWEQSCQSLIGQGQREFLDIGPGGVCKGLMRRIDREIEVIPISTLEEIDALAGS